MDKIVITWHSLNCCHKSFPLLIRIVWSKILKPWREKVAFLISRLEVEGMETDGDCIFVLSKTFFLYSYFAKFKIHKISVFYL